MGDINSILVCRTLFSEQISVDAQVTHRSPLTNFAPPPLEKFPPLDLRCTLRLLHTKN